MESSNTIEQNKDIIEIMKVIPSSLSTQIGLVFFKDTIKTFSLLQNRANFFYSKYLVKMQSKGFYQKDFLAKRLREEQQVCFIVQGIAINRTSGRYYKKGHVVNYRSIFLNEPSQHSLIAYSPIVHTLVFEKSDFLSIINEFEDFKKDIRELIDREDSL